MKAVPAKEMYENFLELLKTQYEPDKIQDGVFGAMMDVGKCILLDALLYAQFLVRLYSHVVCIAILQLL